MESLLDLIAPVAHFVEEKYGLAAAWLASIVVLVLVIALAFAVIAWVAG
jgi:hypothetical protein